MGIIERRKALMEKSKKWAEEAALEKQTPTKINNSMPIESKIDPEFKQYAQKKLLRIILILGAVFSGAKGIEETIKKSTNNAAFPEAKTQDLDRDLNNSQEITDDSFIIEADSEKRVYVIGTGSDGLLLRKEAGTNTEILSSAWDGETFIFTGQTANQDGYLWYQLKDEISGNIYWAASNYLK